MGSTRVLLACALPLAAVLLRCAVSPAIPFVRPSEDAPWIMPAVPVTAELQQWGRAEAPVARFETSFRADPTGDARLRVRALRRFAVYLNGEPVPGAVGDGSRWRSETRVRLDGLRPGANRLRVDVANPHGPPLLALRIEGRSSLRTDSQWSVAYDGSTHAALPADDTRQNPTSLATETPLEALARRRGAALGLFALGALGFAAGRRFAGERTAAALPVAALGAAAAAWVGWFVAVVSRIPPAIGFDARHHLAYVDFIAEKGALPLATDGWSTFHPPLFHLTAWALGPAAYKLLPWLAGLGALALVFGLARRLLPEDPVAQLFAVAFAAVLPMHLYTSAYFSNESFHTLLATAALLGAVTLVLAERSGPVAAAGIGALFGLAALAKFTVLLVAPVALAVLGLAWRGDPKRIAAFCAALLAVAGWYYARNWIALGAPVVANWELSGATQVWWQQPGFHTPAWYTRFGDALVHPYLSGFRSFADAVYSTFWGDGFVAGRVNATDRHGFWNDDWMSAGYVVALPATALLGLGLLLAVRTALRDPDPRRRAAFTVLVGATLLVATAFLYLTLRLPYYAQAKAAYLLVLIGPLSVFFALGARRLDRMLARRWPARAAFWGYVALLIGTLFLGFGLG